MPGPIGFAGLADVKLWRQTCTRLLRHSTGLQVHGRSLVCEARSGCNQAHRDAESFLMSKEPSAATEELCALRMQVLL